MASHSQENDARPAASSSSSQTANRYDLRFGSRDSLVTLASDTAPGLRGPGRTLGLITSFVGMKLEDCVSALAKKMGRTPRAVTIQLEEIGRKLNKRPEVYGCYDDLTPEDVRLMRRLCKELLSWVR